MFIVAVSSVGAEYTRYTQPLASTSDVRNVFDTRKIVQDPFDIRSFHLTMSLAHEPLDLLAQVFLVVHKPRSSSTRLVQVGGNGAIHPGPFLRNMFYLFR